jgi:SNF2 family DNA or RNA helicase
MRTLALPHQKDAVCSSLTSKRRGLVYNLGLGSGKTLTAIMTAEQYGGAVIVAPAALISQWREQLNKWRAKGSYKLFSFDSFHMADARQLAGRVLIVDEAHNARNAASERSQVIMAAARVAKKVIYLTATPFYDSTSDVSTLVNSVLLPHEPRLPTNAAEFAALVEQDPEGVVKLLQNYLVYYNPQDDTSDKERYQNFPKRVDHRTPILATKEQGICYEALRGKNWDKVQRLVSAANSNNPDRALTAATSKAPKKARLAPAPKKGKAGGERKGSVNAFAFAARQIANIVGACGRRVKGNTNLLNLQAGAKTKKLTARVARRLREAVPKLDFIMNKIDPPTAIDAGIKKKKPRVIVFSNFLRSGIEQLEPLLANKKIPFGKFTGSTSAKKRREIVNDYNTHKLRVLLLSSAGGEGLDLKDTDIVIIWEPHWNWSKTEQAVGRAVRFKSHAKPNSVVHVYHLYTVFPPAVTPNTNGHMDRGIEDLMIKAATAKRETTLRLLADLKRHAQHIVAMRRVKCGLCAPGQPSCPAARRIT